MGRSRLRAGPGERGIAGDDRGGGAGDRRGVLAARVRAARRDPDRPVSAALGGGPARAEAPVAAAAVLSLAAADAGEPPGGGAALDTLPRRAPGRRGREPRRESETPGGRRCGARRRA